MDTFTREGSGNPGVKLENLLLDLVEFAAKPSSHVTSLDLLGLKCKVTPCSFDTCVIFTPSNKTYQCFRACLSRSFFASTRTVSNSNLRYNISPMRGFQGIFRLYFPNEHEIRRRHRRYSPASLAALGCC